MNYNLVEGMFTGEGKRIAIIVSRFNEFITNKLLSGSIDCLVRHGVEESDIDVYWVPGAFEIPMLANRIVKKMNNSKQKKYDGILCLGAVIRGATPHFDYVSAEVSKGIAHVGLNSEIPVSFGVLTTDTIEQAIERAGTKSGNKGWDSALSLIEMMNLYNRIG